MLCSKNKLILLCLLLLLKAEIYSQSRLVINNGGYIAMSGGTSGTPIYLVVENSATNAITRITSGHIIAEGEYNRVQWNTRTTIGTFTFPIGRSTTDYLPFVFDKTTAGTESGIGTVRCASWFTAANAVWPSGTSLCGIAVEDDVIDRFWVINVLNYSTNPTATIRFSYKDPGDLDVPIIPEADLRAQRWDASKPEACKWENPSSGTVNTVSDYVEVAGISNFSPWTLTRVSKPLPIELLSFKARWKDQQYSAALLEWQTASEINNSHFEIQRSTDAINFAPIKTVPGAGNSSTIINYEFTDVELLTKVLWGPAATVTFYYRLKQVDYNSSYTYSSIEALNANAPPSGVNLIAIYPNPSIEYIDYLVSSSEDTEVSVFAIDAAGKLVISEKQQIKKGANKYRLDTSFLSNGSYVLQVTANENIKTEKQFVIK